MNWIGSPFLTPKIWGGLFLFFAFFVYPWYFGLSCFFLTTDQTRRKWIKGVMLIGFIYGTLLFLGALFYGFQADAACCAHIQYYFGISKHFPHLDYYTAWSIIIPIYILLTGLPTFISDRRGTNLFGFLTIASAILCWIIYLEYFISVWCFYAAIIVLTITAITCLQWWRITRKFK